MSSKCNGDCSCAGKVDMENSDKRETAENQTNDIDDVWGDDDIEELDNTTADIKRMHSKQGYLDGITNAKESSLQDGFDDLFPKGAELGIIVGNILGSLISSNDEELFEKAKAELNISQVLHKKYFDEELELKSNSEHELIAKWQNVVQNL
ncbi:Uncharacterized protein YAE1 [Debaryomyces fabryi]|uniref:Protein YAE1 n=1 Tax=Debaryomyces fabryi TaxID=58627 RepID=A0A0V1Q416_9ASCO|nr:Uncharacterized protein YAE1 [Debaryomyces fabryi]KSA03275.1 Uncharacterized protein YAE1 [Debaryomyces fabryi]CUM45100.1 unnamed protein product [Debaryomyces fabryi]